MHEGHLIFTCAYRSGAAMAILGRCGKGNAKARRTKQRAAVAKGRSKSDSAADAEGARLGRMEMDVVDSFLGFAGQA